MLDSLKSKLFLPGVSVVTSVSSKQEEPPPFLRPHYYPLLLPSYYPCLFPLLPPPPPEGEKEGEDGADHP